MATVNTAAEEDFLRLSDPYRRELLAHCYRMLGSVHDAEDLVQETYLRAWRAYGNFEGRSSLRTWLHTIATRACLTALEGRRRRPLPTGLGGPGDDPAGELTERPEVPWLEPVPDVLVEPSAADPAAVVGSRESVRLAFVAALQHLPPRQRAVLLLRDVLRWKAAEVAELLDTSTVSVNSALQRARAQLEKAAPSEESVAEPADAAQRELLDRYVEAFVTKDVREIVRLFTEDVVWEMPPVPEWFRGPDQVATLVSVQCPYAPGEARLLPAGFNGQPGYAIYTRGPDGDHHPFALHVLTVAPGGRGISHVGCFFDTSLFATAGLPEVLTDGDLTDGGNR
ncbi:sigma-70 family RNA polymerase sigma factor [Streptomyces sp. NBC_01808]|uniref:sigma-70 family RNA polymerase sigma factor n=1 Tax=Streptomyces sp. NBC_01808 TaxID=2975947 RepID=UPI002DD8DE33|nr:sigma-70 family RNA polymerase sigma factor [Streptomyces sp. NBC_01808]WSA39714.1 sigma-70 family RNA polymerase sigma factor [Streptomyces sp. NBC_01808]